MARIPTIAFESQSEAIANRMLGVKAGIDELAGRLQTSSREITELSALAEQFCQVQNQFRQRLRNAPAISGSLQQRLSPSLSSCEEFVTGVAFDLKRVNGMSQPSTTDAEKVLSCKQLLLLHTHAMGLFSEVLTMQDNHDQESVLTENDEVFDERDRLMAQFNLHSQTSSQATQPTLPEKAGDTLPGYTPTPESSSHDASAAPSSSTAPPTIEISQSEQFGIDDSGTSSGMGGFSGFFKTLSNLPSLLRRIEPLVSPLCQAAAVGSISQIDGLLSEGANIEGLNEDGYTPLISAVLSGHTHAVEHLINKGAKLTTKDSNKVIPPLFHAALAGHLPVMKVLLDKGADPNMRGTFGQPFFVGTMQDAGIEAIRLFLDRGADPNTVSISGKHVAVAAVQRRDVELVRLLLDRGAKTTARSSSGHTLIGIAVDNENMEIVNLLLDRGVDVNTRSPTGPTITHSAISKGNIEMVRLLLARGADADVKDVSGLSMLMNCITKDRPDLVRLLLDYGADANVKDYSNNSALRTAITNDNLNVARLLLEYGADPSEGLAWAGATSSTLGHCVQKDKFEAARLLLGFRADPNRAYQSGQTPLLYAVSKGKIEMTNLLLGGGGNPNVRNSSGETALALSVKDENVDMVRLLLAHGARVFSGAKSPVEIAKKAGRADIVGILNDASPAAAGNSIRNDDPPAYGSA